MQMKVKENKDEIGNCGCGRSPTGKCIGWHGLTEEDFREQLAIYEAKQIDDLNKGKLSE
jgi:hypothetical protein